MKNSYPLDLSALSYPMMRTKRSESNFRFVAELTESVDPTLLTRSLSEVLNEYPIFKTKVVPSFFWHVLRTHDAPLVVKEDDRPPLLPLRKEDTGGYPFRLAYLDKNVVLEVFHAVTDGDIAALFFSDLLTRYAEIRAGEDHVAPRRDLAVRDAFLQHGRKKRLRDVSLRKYNGESVCSLGEGRTYRDAPETLSLEMPLSEIRAAAASYGATITEYVAACYVAAILDRPVKKPICLFLPVDLRRFFPTDTMQNFVCFERIRFNPEESDRSFEHILSVVKGEFREKITAENMRERVDDVRRTLTLPIVKYTPLFIKQPLFKLVKCLLNKVRQTAILSNVGTVTLPPVARSLVRNVKFYLNIGKNAPVNLAVVTYDGICNIDVTNGLTDRSLPDRLFARLTAHGKK